MPTPEYQLECIQNEKIAHGIYDFRFKKPDSLIFDAGQFVLFDVPLLTDTTDIQTRAFSIASAPREPELIFVAKLLEGGRASAWIEQSLQPGDTVRTQGPFGRFLLHEDNPKDYVFICTSTGLAPFRSQILSALQKGENRQIDLLFGAHAEEDLFWQQELDDLATAYPNFAVHYALTKPQSSWKGLTGRVQTVLPQILQDMSTKQVYVCGNPNMTNDVKKLCLEEWQVDKIDLHVEGYI